MKKFVAFHELVNHKDSIVYVNEKNMLKWTEFCLYEKTSCKKELTAKEI